VVRLKSHPVGAGDSLSRCSVGAGGSLSCCPVGARGSPSK
jgi:hypothetical protein